MSAWYLSFLEDSKRVPITISIFNRRRMNGTLREWQTAPGDPEDTVIDFDLGDHDTTVISMHNFGETINLPILIVEQLATAMGKTVAESASMIVRAARCFGESCIMTAEKIKEFEASLDKCYDMTMHNCGTIEIKECKAPRNRRKGKRSAYSQRPEGIKRQ